MQPSKPGPDFAEFAGIEAAAFENVGRLRATGRQLLGQSPLVVAIIATGYIGGVFAREGNTTGGVLCAVAACVAALIAFFASRFHASNQECSASESEDEPCGSRPP